MFIILFALFIILFSETASAVDKQAVTVAGISREEALRLGERMYREGILPSGEPMQAVVQGDIPVDGTMFACVSCHMRSGLGSVEGTIITPPTTGNKLYKPLPKGQGIIGSPQEMLPKQFRGGDVRPAYTDPTLAVALRAGEDPSGRGLDYVMPRYFLNDRDMEILIFYLRNLSANLSPGVSDNTLSFATVIAEGISKKDREAMFATLEAYIRDRASQSRHQELRAIKGPFLEEMNRAYRRLKLIHWELKGPPETWRSQMEAHYIKEPVFGLLGGIASGDWSPVHMFCEQNKIPCVFPITDSPVVSDTDWYTIYISKGLYQEGEAVARYLAGMTEIIKDVPVIQVFRNNREGLVLSKAFKESRTKLDQSLPESIIIGADEVIADDFWKRLAGRHKTSVIVLWLGPEDLTGIEAVAGSPGRPEMIFLSSSLLGQGLYSLHDSIKSFTYLTYPYRLPQEENKSGIVVKNWLKVKKIPVTNMKIQAMMYSLGWILTDAFMMMQSDFYRDYFLDVIDMMRDQTYTVALYPRLSFGPGQRYASKGCYIVQLTEGPNPDPVVKSDWVIH